MKRNIFLIILTAVVLITGCKSLFTREGNLLSSAKQADKRGDYKTAVLDAVESIRIDNEYSDAILFLKDVYPRANNYYSLKIDELKSSGGRFVNDRIAEYYSALKAINEAARTLPPLTDPKAKTQLILSYNDYSSELEKANGLAAEDHYQEGLRLLKLKGRENAKSATAEFEKALSFVPGYRDAAQKADSALEQAVQILAFFPFVNNAWNIPTSQFADNMLNKTISDLLNDSEVMKFTRIVDKQMQSRIISEQMGSMNAMMDDKSRVEIGQLLNANILVSGTVDSASLEGPQTSMTQYHRTADIKVEETEEQSGYYKNQSSDTLNNSTSTADSQSADVTVIGTRKAFADVYVYTKTITFEVTVSYKAVDIETGTLLKSDTLKISLDDTSKWAEWSGEEEALTWEDKNLIDKYEEPVLSAQQIALNAADKAGAKIALGLSSFLK